MSNRDRQEKILLAVVDEYIKTGQPVSSLQLAEKYDFAISSAMIRWELLDLEENGFLVHPYTSSGRIPTEKAYRFFVDYLLAQNIQTKILQKRWKVIENILTEIKAIEEVLSEVAEISKNHLLWFSEDTIYESNLSDTLECCSFESNFEILNFVKFLETVKKFREEIMINLRNQEITVFIGREFPFEERKEISNFSLLGTQSYLPQFGPGALLMIGPTRMNYKDCLTILKKMKEFTTK